MTGEDDKRNNEFSLEEILAEYREKPPEEAPRPEPPEETAPKEPPQPPAGRNRVEREPTVERERNKVVELPRREPPQEEKPPEPEAPAENVIPFPEEEEESPIARLADRLRERADEYAERMFEEEGAGEDPETRRVEELVPGVDVEEEREPVRRERRPKRKAPPPPDIPAGELFRQYSRGLKGLRSRSWLVFVLLLAQCALVLLQSPRLPLPSLESLGLSFLLQVYLSAGALALAMLLGIDVLTRGISRIFRRGMGMDTLVTLACLATLADACTMPILSLRENHLPYTAAATLALFCTMRGELRRRSGLRLACRAAAAAKEPYLVTLDEGKWNGRDTFAKWQGEPAGFGSQIQMEDGAERIFTRVAPLLLLAALLFALIASLGKERPEQLVWCLSANLTAAASLSGLLAYGRPFHKMSRHLSKSGAALAGWPGVVGSRRGTGVVLTDSDLFPPGTVSLNGIKVFGDFSVERVIGYTATLIRASGSGLERIFHDLLRTQGAVYRDCKELQCYEGGGMSATVRGQQVLVGSASFMVLMEVDLPRGLSVKNAVFCAIDGQLAGIFALHYTLHGTVPLAIDALLRGGVRLILATRDFNLIPSMLRQRFKLATDRMEFPPVERRRELSDEESPHSETLTAVLCREGLAPFADAVVGAKRLRAAVRLSAVLACFGSVVGLLMSFYLTFVSAYASLSPFNLTAFTLLWLVPTLLISGWVDRY